MSSSEGGHGQADVRLEHAMMAESSCVVFMLVQGPLGTGGSIRGLLCERGYDILYIGMCNFFREMLIQSENVWESE